MMNKWTCLLLFYAHFAVGIKSGAVFWPHCPTYCRCHGNLNATGLYTYVDCRGRPDVYPNQLSRQIDLMLFNASVNLVELSITNSPLTHVPLSVCRLTTLAQLYLDNNRLKRLPDNCLTNLSNLVRFTATHNAIETLQDGVFDGMRKLEFLDLKKNRIGSIGLSVFATSSNLSSLFTIILSENNLTSLEPWIYDRGIVGSFDKRVTIDLRYNKISKFTNEMGLGPSDVCYNEIPFALVHLEHNGIRHFMDLLNGWQVDMTVVIKCLNVGKYGTNLVMSIGQSKMCDCHDYLFYRSVSMLGKPYDSNLPSSCNLTDPLTKTSRIVNGLYIDLSLFVCELTERCPARCVCVYRPANATLHVYCSDRNLTVLPLELPELPDSLAKYKLDFSNNKLLRRLERRDYFFNTSILDVSNCSVDGVSDWGEIAKIPVINLFGNKLTSLSPSLRSTNITAAKLNLADNPWDCSCDNQWMSDVLVSIADRLTQKVLCYSPPRLRGRNVIQASDESCVDPPREAASPALVTVVSPVAGVVVFLLSVCFIVYRLRVKLYTRFKLHPFDRDECLGEAMDYDVFLSCSSHDNLPHGNGIREKLEERGYRACYPPRDFIAGDTIYDNIYNAVVRSKRTVCLLTENFRQRFVNFTSCCVVPNLRKVYRPTPWHRHSTLLVFSFLFASYNLYR